MNSARETLQKQNVVYSYVNKQNTQWYQASIRCIYTANGIKYVARISNITDKKNIENMLLNSEKNFRTFFETVDDMIFVANKEGKIFFVNNAVIHNLGYSQEQLKGMHILDVHPKEKRDEAEGIFREMFAGNRDTCPLPLAKKDGTLIPVETRIWLGHWDGKDCIYGISKDLTIEKAALDKFYKLFDSNPALMAVSSMPERKFIEVNQAFLDNLGYSREEIIGKTAGDLNLFIEPKKQHLIGDMLQQEGRIRNVELKVRKKDGAILTGLFSGEIIANQTESVFLTVMVDITEKKELERQVSRLVENQNILLYNIQTQVWYLTDEETYGAVNRSHAEFIGLQKEAIAYNKLYEMFPKEIADVCKQSNIKVFSTGKTVHTEEWVYNASGEKRLLSITKSPKLRADGSVEYVVCSAEDITDKKEFENALKESEERYRTIAESISDVVWTLDMNLNITYVSPSIEKLTGESQTEHISKSLAERLPKDSIELLQGVLRQELLNERNPDCDKNRSRLLELEHYKNDKSKLWVSMKVSFLRNEKGTATGIIGVTRDITDRKKAETELNLKSLVLDQISDHVTITDLNGKITYVNNSEVVTMKRSRTDLEGKTIEIYGEDSKRGAAQKEILEETLRQGSWRGEVVNFSSDGSEIIMDCRTHRIVDDNGNPIALAGVSTNITDRKLMEQEIILEKERFKTTLFSVGDGVIATDENGKIQVMNSVAEELTGWGQDEALGTHFDKVFNILNEQTRDEADNPVERVLRTGQKFELANHTALISKSGNVVSIEDTAAPIYNSEGTMQGVVVVFRDVTEKRKARNRIEYLSMHDHLTGLYNRHFFEEVVTKLDDETNMPLSIIMVDVNGLKLINDAFGHEAGDNLLKRAAQIIQNSCRSGDIVARMGGDEFIVLLPNTDDIEAINVKNKITNMASIEKPGNTVVSVAIGCCTKNEMGRDIFEIIKEAENSMYRDKISSSRKMRNQTIGMIVDTINKRYQQEQIHTERVGYFCLEIGKALNLSDKDLRELETAGTLHDIGKVMVPYEILNKPGKLTAEEYEIVKRHTESGYQILHSVDELSYLAEAVLSHHERWDGKGYPQGLKGEKITLYARIIAVADSYEAMTAKRVYRDSISNEEAIEELKLNAGKQFDPQIVKAFVNVVLNRK